MKKTTMLKLLCGRNTVLDAINSNMRINVIYTTRPSEIPESKFKVQKVDKHFLDKMTSENHQGFIATIEGFDYYNIDSIFHDKPKSILMLDHIQDANNFGAIIRSANAFGVKHIIIPKDRSVQLTPAVIKVSSGGIVGMKIIKVSSLITAVDQLKKNNFWIYATSLKDGKDINETSFNDPTCLIIGNEQKGVSQTLLKASDENVFIKTSGSVQSLNVAAATAILLFKV